ncbi:MAG TPA: MerR family transcriptional regulator [Firmicutes bacterium]|nr:MerR family transcriptional regulator [Bacillota bacterium]
MVYTVGETAKVLGVAPSTIRYYDKEGLLPFVERSGGGIRMFQEKDFEWLFVIDCLKKTGMPIKDIKRFIDMALKGDETIDERLELFLKRRENVKEQMRQLQNTLDILDYKCWYYQTAKEAGTTDVMRDMDISDVPEELRAACESLKRMHRED